MRAIIQRVKRASVTIDDNLKASIGKGLLVLIAVSPDDTDKDLNYMADKIVGLRIFNDEDDKMNLSLDDIKGEIMVISQFTLYGDVRKGKRPSFINSAKGDFAKEYYEKFLKLIKDKGYDVKSGEFGADMKVELINDGPVTIQIDSSKLY